MSETIKHILSIVINSIVVIGCTFMIYIAIIFTMNLTVFGIKLLVIPILISVAFNAYAIIDNCKNILYDIRDIFWSEIILVCSLHNLL